MTRTCRVSRWSTARARARRHTRTGVGTGLFLDGKLMPHLELSHHPFRKDQTYDEQLGDAALRKIG